MAISKQLKAELQMLRELAWMVIPQLNCYFCRQPLARPVLQTYGHRRHSAIPNLTITVHHKNHNRDDNVVGSLDAKWPGGFSSGNLRYAHTLCHRKYHAQMYKKEDRDERELDAEPE